MLGAGYDARSFYVRSSPADAWTKTYTGANFRPEAAGRLMNLRLAQALFHDEWLTEEAFGPEANTDRVIAALDTYREHGVLAINASLQGGNPGYGREVARLARRNGAKFGPGKGLLVSAFLPDGSLKPAWMTRLLRLQRALDRRGMILGLMYFYQGQDEVLADVAAIRRAVVNATDWLIENNCRNVIIEIANEHDINGWDHARYIHENMGALIELARSRFADKHAPFRLPIGSSTGGGMKVFDATRGHADLVMIHGNGRHSQEKRSAVERLYKDPSMPGPIYMNEDDNGRDSTEENFFREIASAEMVWRSGGSWGYMPWRQAQMFPFRFYLPAAGSELRDDMPLDARDQAYFRAVLEYVRGLVFQDAPARIMYHNARLDSSGRLLAWTSYDRVVRLVWDFWRNMRRCANGVPYYMQHQVWKPGADDPRGLGGDQINMALSSWRLLYGYLGDEAVKKNMIFMADYWLANGMPPAGAKWPLPYPYNTDLHSGKYDGDMRAGKGITQPDKAASFGAELVALYKMTGDRRYLDAATGIADTLARHVQPGDNDHSPWPFRVNAVTGEAGRVGEHTGTYTANFTGALVLFEELMALKHGGVEAYAQAHETLARWFRQYPIRTNKWGPFFEDIPGWSDTETNADTMAMYIIEHPAFDANWRAMANGILGWSLDTFANHEYTRFGVIPIDEQTAYRVPGNSHTSRHASVELMYCEATGDCALKDDAIRRLNWATYTVAGDGRNRYVRDDIWLTDGYGDYVRHYLRAMAAAPELAPEGQNHLLRTSSVVQSIAYAADAITYTKFDAASAERFRMGAWTPRAVKGGSMHWDPKTGVLEIKAAANTVRIVR